MKKSFLILIPFFLSLLLITNDSTLAEDPPPTPPPPYQPIKEKRPLPPGMPAVDENGLWHVDQSFSGPSSQEITPLAVGGPDEYGYTWDDSEPFA